MKKGVALLVFSASILWASEPARAGVNRFTDISPEGASISVLIVDSSNPLILYAGSRAGVHKSLDGGESWALSVDSAVSDASHAERTIVSLGIDALDRTTVYAGLHTGEILKTVDGGEVWSLLPGIPVLHGVFSLVVDPTREGTLYAVTWNNVVRSTDGGVSWTPWLVEQPVPANQFRALAMDPWRPSRMFASSDVLLMTTDRGEHWTSISSSPADRVVTDPRDPATIHVAAGRSILSTRDLGTTWTRTPIGEANVFDIVVNPVSSDAYALIRSYPDGVDHTRVLVTADKGRTWNPLAGSLENTSMLVIDPTDGRKFYASRFGRLFTSANSGAGWRPINAGFSTPYVTDLAVDPVTPSTLYAATSSGIMKSLDGGQQWSEEKLSYRTARLALDPSQPSTVFAFDWRAKPARSTDGGESWSEINPGERVTGIAVDPSNSSLVYAVLSDNLARSINGGADWGFGVGNLPLAYYGFGGSSIVVDPEVPSIVYAAGEGGIVKSEDSGATWNTIFKDPEGRETYFLDLVIDPVNPSTIYALSYRGVFRSENSGRNWTPVDSPAGDQTSNQDLAIDPTEPSRLYLGTSRGLFRSAGRGEHWFEFGAGLPSGTVNKVTVDALGNVFASTPRGLFVSTPNGDRPEARYQVTLRTYYGNYVSATDCGGSSLNANATTAGRCESFALFDLNNGQLNDGDRVQLRAATGAYVVAEGGGRVGGGNAPVSANRPVAGIWETFVIHRTGGAGEIRSGDSISLQSFSGSYVAAENGGGNGCRCGSVLNANRAGPGEWERFTLAVD